MRCPFTMKQEGKSAVDLAIEGKCFLLADKLVAAGGRPQRSKKLMFKDVFGKKRKRVVGKVSETAQSVHAIYF